MIYLRYEPVENNQWLVCRGTGPRSVLGYVSIRGGEPALETLVPLALSELQSINVFMQAQVGGA